MQAEKVKPKPSKSATAAKLGDETFMSATELRHYMTEVEMAKASKDIGSTDRAEQARAELMKSLATPIELTPEKLKEITRSLLHKLRGAAERGQTELMVMRFPNTLCTDKGRALNNSERMDATSNCSQSTRKRIVPVHPSECRPCGRFFLVNQHRCRIFKK